MVSEGHNVVIIMYQFSVVIKGIEGKLKELGYRVDVVAGSLYMLNEHVKNTSFFILYLPRDILDNNSSLEMLSSICEMLMVDGNRLLILGEAAHRHDLVEKCPEIKAFEWMDRPVDMAKFTQTVERMTGAGFKSQRKKRILIVDDDPSYAKMVREWIKELYRVDIVTAGMQAISFLLKVNEDEPVDMILLDYEMPVVDGPQVLQMLRQDPATENIPVIFLTGIGTKEAVSRVMELKPAGYLLKSTTRENLTFYLFKHLGLKE